MTGLRIVLEITAVAVVVLVFMLVSRRQKKTSLPETPRVVGGFMVGDEVTFLNTNGRRSGWIVRFRGFTRSFVLCDDGELRRVKISRMEAA